MESSRRLLEQAVEAMPIAMVAVSGEGLVTLWNPASEQLFGLDGREALGTDWTGIAEITDVATLVNGQMIASSVEQARAAVMTSRAWAGRLDLRRHTDGRPVIAYCSVSTLDDPAGEKAGALAILQDATAEDLLRRQRDIQRRLAQTVLDISPTMTLVLDRDQRIVMANASWFRGATELGDVPLVGDDFRQLALGSALIAHAREVVPLSAEVSRIIDGPAGSGEVDVEIADARGMVRTFSVHMVRIQPGNGHDNPAVLLVLTDVSVRRAQERQLARQANHDPLTGLPNRGVAEEELTRALARSARTGRNVAVL